jgi:hypothetical protein
VLAQVRLAKGVAQRPSTGTATALLTCMYLAATEFSTRTCSGSVSSKMFRFSKSKCSVNLASASQKQFMNIPLLDGSAQEVVVGEPLQPRILTNSEHPGLTWV